MTVYCIALIDITDRDRYDTYIQGFREIFSRYSGKLLSVEEEPDVREGSWPYNRTVLIEFSDSASFDAWYNSPDYQALAKHRYDSATTLLAVIRQNR
jgi:uncharacterized protein (DUF1330 family)